tara:strand:- start:100 stop:846 length:747 start_codon:yes stop_codon:yes gene_type:complete
MGLKKGYKLDRIYSLNFSQPKRDPKTIKFIILHYTGMKKESSALKRLCDPKAKVSSHYFIKNNGQILNLVPDLYEAWHAGKSNWKNLKSLNKYSIGIEITNPGHQHGYKKFTLRQIHSLKKLLKNLMKKYKIDKRCILGHSDISPDRKKDPGEKFPWQKLSKSRLCLWHRLSHEILKKLRRIKLKSKKEESEFLNNLAKIGYIKLKQKKSKSEIRYIVKAFQRRFRQSLINGKIDKECFLISKKIVIL